MNGSMDCLAVAGCCCCCCCVDEWTQCEGLCVSVSAWTVRGFGRRGGVCERPAAAVTNLNTGWRLTDACCDRVRVAFGSAVQQPEQR